MALGTKEQQNGVTVEPTPKRLTGDKLPDSGQSELLSQVSPESARLMVAELTRDGVRGVVNVKLPAAGEMLQVLGSSDGSFRLCHCQTGDSLTEYFYDKQGQFLRAVEEGPQKKTGRDAKADGQVLLGAVRTHVESEKQERAGLGEEILPSWGRLRILNGSVGKDFVTPAGEGIKVTKEHWIDAMSGKSSPAGHDYFNVTIAGKREATGFEYDVKGRFIRMWHSKPYPALLSRGGGGGIDDSLSAEMRGDKLLKGL